MEGDDDDAHDVYKQKSVCGIGEVTLRAILHHVSNVSHVCSNDFKHDRLEVH